MPDALSTILGDCITKKCTFFAVCQVRTSLTSCFGGPAQKPLCVHIGLGLIVEHDIGAFVNANGWKCSRVLLAYIKFVSFRTFSEMS